MALWSLASLAASIAAPPVEAAFRGCEDSGWCRFWFEAPGDAGPSLHRVLPDGLRPGMHGPQLRDRLNALMADMIHQHKRIELHDLRTRPEGGLAATVTVTGIALTDDPILSRFLGEFSTATQPR